MFCSRAETSSLIPLLPDISSSKAFLWLNLAVLLCLCPRQDPVIAKLPQCEKRSGAVSDSRISKKAFKKKVSWKRMSQKKPIQKQNKTNKHKPNNNKSQTKNQTKRKNLTPAIALLDSCVFTYKPKHLSTTNQSSRFVAKFFEPLLKLKRAIFQFCHFRCT